MSGPVGVYCRCGSWRVETSVELDALLHAIAAVVGPSWVELVGADGAVLRVAVGRDDLSSITYVDPTTEEHLACIGTRLPLGDELFDDRGLPAPLDPHSAITATDARAAVVEFFETGQRPIGLDWRVHGHQPGSAVDRSSDVISGPLPGRPLSPLDECGPSGCRLDGTAPEDTPAWRPQHARVGRSTRRR